MNAFTHSMLVALVSSTVLTAYTTAQAVPLSIPIPPAPSADTALPGTTVAARPELAGVVLQDLITPFSFDGITGTVQNRVVKENAAGTLDFYWKINVDSSATGGGITAFRLGDFGFANITDADWRIDGLGTDAPDTGRLFSNTADPGGAINFLFDKQPVLDGQASRFFFLHTDATSYARTASFDMLCGPSNCISGSTSTFAPAVPEPSTLSLVVGGLFGLLIKRRMKA
ncbi:MAG TPA: PEP-CTERM sorting domain-containing protein [Myxococcota bacterium]|nr:PEP-CTERM sorting domain-containing protein [Myxococcota bacterium]